MRAQREPILYFEIDTGEDGFKRVEVFEGDNPLDVATSFAKTHGKFLHYNLNI